MSNIWNKQVKLELCKLALKNKSNGLPILDCFKSFAEKFDLDFKSVRNYFYKHIKELSVLEPKLADFVKSPKPFNDKDLELLDKVCKLVSCGKSVRYACKAVGLNSKDSLRLQNKYRWLDKKGLLVYTPKNVSIANRNSNTIHILKPTFKKPKENAPATTPQVLSNDDLQKLFNGVVKLISKSIVDSNQKTNLELVTSLRNKNTIQSKEIDTLKKENNALYEKLKILEGLILQLKNNLKLSQ